MAAGAGVTITGHAEVRAVLADPCFAVPPHAGPQDAEDGLAWPRRTVSRFSTGSRREHRCPLVLADLRGLDPSSLRAAAREEATGVLSRLAAGREEKRAPV